MAVIYCDLDGLKEVNDTHGHAAGDKLLQAVADRIQSAVRGQDLVARIGGDEFVILLDGVPTDSAALRVAESVARTVATTVELAPGAHVIPTLSFGISTAPRTDDLGPAIERADRALYRMKSDRRVSEALAIESEEP